MILFDLKVFLRFFFHERDNDFRKFVINFKSKI